MDEYTKIRVDLTAHTSVVVRVKYSDDMYDEAAEIAEEYVNGNPAIDVCWEFDDGGFEEVDASEDAVNDNYDK